jgi:Domain of unknown function (DUF4147)
VTSAPAPPTLGAGSLLRAMFDAAVATALPAQIVPAHLPAPPKGRAIVLGAGKASAAMAVTVAGGQVIVGEFPTVDGFVGRPLRPGVDLAADTG